MAETSISGLLVTGMLAVLGTVTGNVVKGYWDSDLAAKDFQSKLILRALESKETEERITSLKFLVKTKLIADPNVRAGIELVLDEGRSSIPRFQPISVRSDADGVIQERGAQESLLSKYPQLRGANVALVGFRVRAGDIIDAITPIYARIDPQLALTDEYEGARFGGAGGKEVVLKHAGYVVTGVDIQRAYYFGRTEVVSLKVTWTRFTEHGLDPTSVLVSEKLGTFKSPSTDEHLHAAADAFISDFRVLTSHHTTGDTYLNDFKIAQTVVIKPQRSSR